MVQAGRSVADPFLRRCLPSYALLPLPQPTQRAGRPDLPHPPLREDSRNRQSHCTNQEFAETYGSVPQPYCSNGVSRRRIGGDNVKGRQDTIQFRLGQFDAVSSGVADDLNRVAVQVKDFQIDTFRLWLGLRRTVAPHSSSWPPLRVSSREQFLRCDEKPCASNRPACERLHTRLKGAGLIFSPFLESKRGLVWTYNCSQVAPHCSSAKIKLS
jgi:hypothetical protein